MQRICFFSIFFMVLSLFFTPLKGLYAAEVRYEQIGNTAKILIPFSENNDYKIETNETQLFITFKDSVGNIFSDAATTLNNFIKKQNISEDNKKVSFDFAHPYTMKTSQENGFLIIEIKNKKNPIIDSEINIDINYGEHSDYNRLSFEYNRAPKYSVKADKDSAVISFLVPVNINTENLKGKMIYNYLEKSPNQFGGYDIKIRQPLLKTFEYQNKIVLDFSPNSYNNISKQTSPSSTIIYQANTQATNKDQVASLAFPWNMEVGVSVFKRGKYIWIAFDHSRSIDLEELNLQSRNVAEEIIQVPHSQATILRITPKENVKVGLRQEGLLWIVDLYTHNIEYKIKELPIFIQYNSLRQSYLYIPTTSGGNALSVIDPEIGDVILIGTNTELGYGISEAYQYPDLELLSSKQGFAIAPNSADILLSKSNSGFSIKGNNRSLNISDNLENLKRQQQIWQSSTDTFNLITPPQLLNLDFNSAERRLKEDIENSPADQRSKAKLQLIKYYLGMGLGSEAKKQLDNLNDKEKEAIKPETISALYGVANFLLHRYDDALDNFSHEKLQDNNEAIFWRTLTSSAINPTQEDDIILLTLSSIMTNYPQELQERIALIAADTAIQANNDISTQNFMDVLKNVKSNDMRKAQVLYLNAKKYEYQGYPNNALKEYGNVLYHQSQKYTALARYARINLELKLNLISAKQAIPELERLKFAWGEPKFKLQLLQKLAEVYAQDKQYHKAMSTYKSSMELANTIKEKEIILTKMIKLFEDLYMNGKADEMSPVKAIALYKDFDWLAPRSNYYTSIAQKLADRMVAVDLLSSATELLKEQLRLMNLSEEQRAQLGSRLALIYLFEEDNIAALKVLEQTDAANISKNQQQYRKIIKAKALAQLNKNEEALNLLADDYSKNAILVKSDIYWKTAQWDKAADTIKYLIEKPQEGKALSSEQISYILDWITALKKSGKTTVIYRIRNTFAPYFKDSIHADSFNVLTNNLEAETVDMNAIGQAVNDIAAYSDFSKIYDESLIEQKTPVDIIQ